MRLTKIDRYIAGMIFVPMVGTLVIAAMLLLLDKMLKLFDFVVNEGGPVTVVWRMLGNLIPQYLALGVPIGLFLGVLLAFRKLAINSELDSLISSGIPYARLLRVPMLFAIGLVGINLVLVGYIQPVARATYEGLVFDLRSGAFGASVKIGEFVKFGKDVTLRIDESHNQGTDLRGIFARVSNGNGENLVINAVRGTFLSSDNPNIILFRLTDGIMLQTNSKWSSPRQLTFAQHDFPINLPKMNGLQPESVKELEMTIPQLLKTINDPHQDKTLRMKSSASFYRRVVQSLVMLFLPFLGIAFAVPPKRSGSAIGVFAGIVVLVTYNKISEALEKISVHSDVLPPSVVQIVPFILFGWFCYHMYHILAHDVAGQPLAALERSTTLAARMLVSVFGPLARRLGMLPPDVARS